MTVYIYSKDFPIYEERMDAIATGALWWLQFGTELELLPL